MNELVEKRAQTLAEYIVETGATVRAAAKRFDVSKSTVHTDVSLRLKEIDHDLGTPVLLFRVGTQRKRRQLHWEKPKWAAIAPI